MGTDESSPDWQPLERLEMRLEAGVHVWSVEDVDYLRNIAEGLGLDGGPLEEVLSSDQGRSQFVREARRLVSEGSRQLMRAIVHARAVENAEMLASVRSELDAIVEGPVELYRRLARYELRKLAETWGDP